MLTEPAGLWWLFFFSENTGGTRGGRDLIVESNIFTAAQFPAFFFVFFKKLNFLNFVWQLLPVRHLIQVNTVEPGEFQRDVGGHA